MKTDIVMEVMDMAMEEKIDMQCYGGGYGYGSGYGYGAGHGQSYEGGYGGGSGMVMKEVVRWTW